MLCCVVGYCFERNKSRQFFLKEERSTTARGKERLSLVRDVVIAIWKPNSEGSICMA